MFLSKLGIYGMIHPVDFLSFVRVCRFTQVLDNLY